MHSHQSNSTTSRKVCGLVLGFLLLSFGLQPVFPALASGQRAAVKWPAGVSKFCKMVLNSCFKNCFNILKNKSSAGGSFNTLHNFDGIAANCYSRCWNSPFRKRMCKVKKSVLLQKGDLVLTRFQGEWKREQRRLEKEKAYIRLILRSEQLRQKQLTRERKLRTSQLLAQQSKLNQEKQRLKEVQAELKEARREAIKKQKSKDQFSKLRREQKQLQLQRKLMKEEQQRLALAKKLSREQKQKAAKRKQEFQSWMQRMQKLRKQRIAELQQLKQQANQERTQLQELKKLKSRSKELAKKQQALEIQRQAAKRKRLSREVLRLTKARQRLKRMMKRLTYRRRRIRKQRARARRARRRKMTRLAKLNRQSDVHRRRWKVRRKRRRNYRYFFQKGNLNRAQTLAVGKSRKWVTEFTRMYYDGQTAHDQRSPNKALPKLERALTLELRICRGKSTFHSNLKKMLVAMYVMKGILALNRSNYTAAYLYFSRGYRHSPRSEAAKQNLQKLHRIANNLYNKGLRFEGNRQLANRFFRKALSCIPSNSKLAQKIRKKLY